MLALIYLKINKNTFKLIHYQKIKPAIKKSKKVNRDKINIFCEANHNHKFRFN